MSDLREAKTKENTMSNATDDQIIKKLASAISVNLYQAIPADLMALCLAITLQQQGIKLVPLYEPEHQADTQ